VEGEDEEVDVVVEGVVMVTIETVPADTLETTAAQVSITSKIKLKPKRTDRTTPVVQVSLLILLYQ